VHSSTKADIIISLPSKGTYKLFSFIIKGLLLTVIFLDIIQGLKSDCKLISSFSLDDANLSHPETLRAHNQYPFRRKLSFLPWCTDDELCHVDTNAVLEILEIPLSTIKISDGASISNKGNNGLLSHYMLYEGEEGLLDIPLSEVQPSFKHMAEISPP
jgi:hypothetical protein